MANNDENIRAVRQHMSILAELHTKVNVQGSQAERDRVDIQEIKRSLRSVEKQLNTLEMVVNENQMLRKVLTWLIAIIVTSLITMGVNKLFISPPTNNKGSNANTQITKNK